MESTSEDSGRHGDGQARRPGVGSDPAADRSVAEHEVEDAFLAVVDQGRRRMSRRTVPLLATGVVGGIDVGTGVLGMLYVESQTGDNLLGGLAFSFGFVVLTLARSELFTEDFLVPVSTVIARQARLRMLLRLWVGTLVANLAGGWIFTWFIIEGFPQVHRTAIESGTFYVHLGLGLRAFSLAVLGGAVITMMTWMQHSSDHVLARVVAAVGAGFLLGGLRLNHAIVNSLLIFAALQTGHASFGYAQWLQTAGLAAGGNMVGGITLVTLLRLFQVPHKVLDERAHPAMGVPIGDHRREARVEGA
ncbi:MAG: formate/nitrite transporter family protein [Acidobacteriota bacterium]|nr:formate/nitrite transporter family protein [Acidobacteriota bacterium]